MKNNITYLFGAGASYYACPIWKEQAKCMFNLHKVLKKTFTLEKGEERSLSINDKLIWEISYYGKKALEFNTVDTYARKLFLADDRELESLKRAISNFFTIWSLTDNTEWKNLFYINDKKKIVERNEFIDHRYINLLASYLEKGSPLPTLRDNIKFISWNYDLQLESAYIKFCPLGIQDFIKGNKYFQFIPKDENSNLDVLHLNGYCGFFGEDEAYNLYKRSDSKNLNEIINEINFDVDPKNIKVHFDNYINYSWDEKSVIANNIRNQALNVMRNTDILVVVGYSFPPFNNSIDNVLIKAARRLKKFVYQDPNANIDFIRETFGIPKNKISIINESLEQFFIPNYTFPENGIGGISF
ncbi:MAG: hypothetical protein BWY70_00408 [Bacteroidetes bacterium ADurb.Bin408]|nr:MAG: hypothetical protein BWY70_00408 [Bacteroidetes bacterium ADurb.Bin408]